MGKLHEGGIVLLNYYIIFALDERIEGHFRFYFTKLKTTYYSINSTHFSYDCHKSYFYYKPAIVEVYANNVQTK